MQDINKILAQMHKCSRSNSFKSKGNLGEDAALQIVLSIQKKIGGLVYHSFSYPYATDRSGKTCTGNIKWENGRFKEYTESNREIDDEIDILFVTHYRIFPIEVKAYHAKMTAYDHWFKKNGTMVDKSPIFQTEKHARHLYTQIASVIPDGNPNYVVPLCCFVDRCTITDDRSDDFSRYIPITILNNFEETLKELNTPLQYNLELESIKNKLNEIKVSCDKAYI